MKNNFALIEHSTLASQNNYPYISFSNNSAETANRLDQSPHRGWENEK